MTRRQTHTDGSPGDALALLQQALAQAGGAGSLHAPAGVSFVDAMPFLIQLASGDDEAISIARKRIAVDTAADANALRSGAMQCLRQHYLSHADDPYRVLGLNPWAGESQVRERYRKLIRLFHPDRGALHEDADTALAANLNLAYERAGQQRLGGAQAAPQAAQRASSAGSSHYASHSAAGNPSASRSHRKRSGSLSRWWRWINPISWIVAIATSLGLLRLRRSAIWSLLVLIGAAVVAAAWLGDRLNDQHRWLVVQNDRPAARPVPPTFEPDPVPLDDRLTQEADALQAMPPQAAPPAAALNERVTADVRPTIQLTSPSLSARAAATDLRPDTALRLSPPVQKAAVTPAATVSPQRAVTAEPTRVPAPSATPAAVVRIAAETVAPASPPPLPPSPPPPSRPFSASPDDIERFLAHFLGSYADGDLDQLLSLMQENMSYDTPGGKAAARRNYQRLFQASSSRDLILRDVVWNRYGERMVASPRYEERVTLRSSGEIQYQKGVMHIELIDQGGKITIGALSHKTLGQAQ